MVTAYQRQQAASGLEQLAALARTQSWRRDATPSLPPTQGAVLRMLAGLDLGLRARQIAERLGISAASLSDSLKAMTAKQWVARVDDPLDKRAALVRLTDTGEALAAQLHDPSHGMHALLQGLGEDDIGALLRVTQLLVREAQQQGLATGQRTCLGCRFFHPHASGSAERPHFCAFVGQPFGDPELRVDCAEHVRADAAHADDSALRYRHASATTPGTENQHSP